MPADLPALTDEQRAACDRAALRGNPMYDVDAAVAALIEALVASGITLPPAISDALANLFHAQDYAEWTSRTKTLRAMPMTGRPI